MDERKARFRRTAAVLVATLSGVLAACGGGGDDDDDGPATTAEGAYAGSISGSSSTTAFSAVVLDDGQLWTVYGNNVGGVLVLSGFLQGQGTSSHGVFTASNLRDFGSSPPVAASLAANYVAGASLSGNLSESGATFGISGTAIPAAVYNYNAPASLAGISGAWTLAALGGTSLPLTIASNGAATGVTSGGCSVAATFTPRASGKNVFNLAITFGPAPCPVPSGTAAGIAILSTLSGGAHQLMAAAVDPSRTIGTLAVGTR